VRRSPATGPAPYPQVEPIPVDPISHQIDRLLDLITSGLMDRPEPYDPLPPFFEFSSAEASTMGLRRPWERRLTPTFNVEGSGDMVVYVLDGLGEIHQEPPQLEAYGADGVFDSQGRVADLGVEDFAVVVKRWSRLPKADVFDQLLRAAAASYLPATDAGALSTFEIRDLLVPVLRQYQREQILFWPLQKAARRLWRSVSRRSD
jgi:hypothetical protein